MHIYINSTNTIWMTYISSLCLRRSDGNFGGWTTSKGLSFKCVYIGICNVVFIKVYSPLNNLMNSLLTELYYSILTYGKELSSIGRSVKISRTDLSMTEIVSLFPSIIGRWAFVRDSIKSGISLLGSEVAFLIPPSRTFVRRLSEQLASGMQYCWRKRTRLLS